MEDILTPDCDAAMRAYYDQRAGEYDQWYLREGRFAERPGVKYLRERMLIHDSRHAVRNILRTPETIGAALAPMC
jgi:hypothetical protein